MHTTNRRRFLKRAAVATAGFMIVPRPRARGTGYTARATSWTKAIIGVGGMGRGHLTYEGTRLLAICDVDRKHLEEVLAMAGKGRQGVRRLPRGAPAPGRGCHSHRDPPALARPDVGRGRPRGQGHLVREADDAHDRRRHPGRGRGEPSRRMFRLNTWFRFKESFYGLGTDVKPLKKVVQSGVLGWPLNLYGQRHHGVRLEVLLEWPHRSEARSRFPRN